MKTSMKVIYGLFLSMYAAAATAADDDFLHWLYGTHFDGQVRAYYFTRAYAAPNSPDQDAFSLAAILNVRTAEFLGGVSLGGSLFTANSLGTQSSNPKRVDLTLMGSRNASNVPGQAYLQYRKSSVLLKLGDQLLDTPWANRSDSRVLPASYQSALGEWSPSGSLKFQVVRILRYKGRTSDDYFRDNNYYPATYKGDSNYGGVVSLPANAPSTDGTLAAGASYSLAGLKGSAWFYDFHQFARMAYVED